jgi:hypothetical protein
MGVDEVPELPASFSCPISQEVMRDPVTLSDGHSYERRAIERWLLSGHSTSPMTGALLQDTTVVPNHALRNSILEHFQQRGHTLPPLSPEQPSKPASAAAEQRQSMAAADGDGNHDDEGSGAAAAAAAAVDASRLARLEAMAASEPTAVAASGSRRAAGGEGGNSGGGVAQEAAAESAGVVGAEASTMTLGGVSTVSGISSASSEPALELDWEVWEGAWHDFVSGLYVESAEQLRKVMQVSSPWLCHRPQANDWPACRLRPLHSPVLTKRRCVCAPRSRRPTCGDEA